MNRTTPPNVLQWTPQRVVLATLVVMAVLLAFYLLVRFYIVVFILFVALVIGVAIRPPVEWLHRRGVPRQLGVILVYLFLLAFTVGFVLLLAPLLIEQATTILQRFPEYYDGLLSVLFSSPSRLVQRLAMALPGLPTAGTAPAPATPPGAASLDLVNQILAYLSMAGRAIFVSISILVLAFYWTLDGQRTIRSLLLRAPVEKREGLQEAIEEIEEKVGAYVRGVIILSAAVGLMAAPAFLLIGLPYALVLALVAGVLEAVPVLGPVLGAIPPLLLAITLDPSKAPWVIVAVLLIQQLEANLLVPRVMDRAVGVNPIVTILSIAALLSLFGIGGALVAIPLAAIIQVMMDRLVFSRTMEFSEQPIGRDRYSALRYEAQSLIQDVRKQVRNKEDATDIEVDTLEDLIETIAVDVDSALTQLELSQGGAR